MSFLIDKRFMGTAKKDEIEFRFCSSIQDKDKAQRHHKMHCCNYTLFDWNFNNPLVNLG
jgi:hypothetical protein